MPYYLLLCRSVTHAQRMSALLERAGITARYYRAPMTLSDRGCGYTVRVSASHYGTAMDVLRRGGMLPVRVFYAGGDGKYREAALP